MLWESLIFWFSLVSSKVESWTPRLSIFSIRYFWCFLGLFQSTPQYWAPNSMCFGWPSIPFWSAGNLFLSRVAWFSFQYSVLWLVWGSVTGRLRADFASSARYRRVTRIAQLARWFVNDLLRFTLAVLGELERSAGSEQHVRVFWRRTPCITSVSQPWLTQDSGTRHHLATCSSKSAHCYLIRSFRQCKKQKNRRSGGMSPAATTYKWFSLWICKRTPIATQNLLYSSFHLISLV